ncbi:MAG: hypothetical protein LBT09_14150 [Planctomycetaceae bacterium]|nr:hypothetical protein [Planctomycetaceae bacterium]
MLKYAVGTTAIRCAICCDPFFIRGN